jgi:hypothetical protein
MTQKVTKEKKTQQEVMTMGKQGGKRKTSYEKQKTREGEIPVGNN